VQAVDLRSYEEVKQEQQRQQRRKGLGGLVAAADRHKLLILGALVLMAGGGYVLYQQGVFAAVAAQLQAAYAAAGRLWAVAANLVRCTVLLASAGHGWLPVLAASIRCLTCASKTRRGEQPTFTAPCPVFCSKLPFPHIHDSEKGLLETIWLLLASVVMVPLICKIPGGSPVLGFLVRQLPPALVPCCAVPSCCAARPIRLPAGLR
jgi:hypothetical protein